MVNIGNYRLKAPANHWKKSPVKKRSMYRKRYEMLDDLSEKITQFS